MAETICNIGESVTVVGDISGDEDLLVQGRVQGNITLSTHLTVEAGGAVEGNVDTESLTVHGTVEGDIRAAERVSLSEGAKVNGDITTSRISIEQGAQFRGQVNMDVQLPAGLQSR